MPVGCFRIAGLANVEIESSVSVNIRESNSGGPDVGRSYAGFSCDVAKKKVALVQVKFIVDLVARKEDVLKAVIVDISEGYTRAIIKVSIGVGIHSFRKSEVVAELNAAFNRDVSKERGKFRVVV